MLRPSLNTIRNSLEANGLDPATAWALVTGPPERPQLVGVRATEGEIDKLARVWRRRVQFVQVTTVAELLQGTEEDPALRRVLDALATARRGA